MSKLYVAPMQHNWQHESLSVCGYLLLVLLQTVPHKGIVALTCGYHGIHVTLVLKLHCFIDIITLFNRHLLMFCFLFFVFTVLNWVNN